MHIGFSIIGWVSPSCNIASPSANLWRNISISSSTTLPGFVSTTLPCWSFVFHCYPLDFSFTAVICDLPFFKQVIIALYWIYKSLFLLCTGFTNFHQLEQFQTKSNIVMTTAGLCSSVEVLVYLQMQINVFFTSLVEALFSFAQSEWWMIGLHFFQKLSLL